MTHIKKLAMNGFKSFAKKTEIFFDDGINILLGPNGSGKSNVADSLCFVLGRLSAKSMRAAKSRNFLFMGSKYIKPSHEASVEVVFDNSDKTFAINADEIAIKRIVRHNGQGIYKINGETKTRVEILEILAQAGIDPYGFNLVLQGEIQSLVKMHPEERRKILEEVAGIAVYEARKEKSLHELEKTDEKLKEINAVLRERTAFLRNLESERQQALKYKELELMLRRCKASILHRRIEGKEKELTSLIKSLNEKSEHKEKLKSNADNMQKEIDALSGKINEINKHIQQATGLEQETLHSQIADLKAGIEGLKVKLEHYENRRAEAERRIQEVRNSIPEYENEIQNLRKKSPAGGKKDDELKKKKNELEILEDERKKLLAFKAELNSVKEKIRDKEKQHVRLDAESEALLKHLEEDSTGLGYKNSDETAKAVKQFKNQLALKRKEIGEFNKKEIELEKIISVAEAEIRRLNVIKADVSRIDICPLCSSKITENHVAHVSREADEKIRKAENEIESAGKEIKMVIDERNRLTNDLILIGEKTAASEIEILKHSAIKERNDMLKRSLDEKKAVMDELEKSEEKRNMLEKKINAWSNIDEKYDSLRFDIDEISARSEENADITMKYKEIELEKAENIVKRGEIELEELDGQIKEISETIDRKNYGLEQKEEQERKLSGRFKQMFKDRDNLQGKIQEKSLNLSELQADIRGVEEQVNYLNIGKARLDAEKEAYGMEIKDFAGVEIIQGSLNMIEDRFQKTQTALMSIGSINMRALEVYEGVKQEYEKVQEKTDTLTREKEEILKIIAEIDGRKKRTFMKTFKAINELFTANFSKLSGKGVAFLEIENPEDIFAGGVNIIIKLAKGKYFDVTSLSGGEKSLVALALLFAVQEYKPYHFYVFDEIDAALDKRNSERLAGLLNQYMKSGQYIVITHNDAIVTGSDVKFLYGVSMQDGVSKVLSLKV